MYVLFRQRSGLLTASSMAKLNPEISGLTDSGWVSAGTCQCGGVLKYKYAKMINGKLSIIKVPSSGSPNWNLETNGFNYRFDKNNLTTILEKYGLS